MLTLLALFLSCAREAPRHQIVVCDGTGKAPADVCMHAFLEDTFLSWARDDAHYRAGTTWRVVTTASDMKTTALSAVIQIPPTPSSGLHGWSSWAEAQLPAIAGIAIPHDENPSRNAVKSNLVAAMRVAATIARADLAGQPVDLVIASDGMQIGENIDLEGTLRVSRRRPLSIKPFAKVVPALSKGPMGFDLSVFASIEVCGFHHHAEVAKLADRDRFWTMLFEVGQAPPRSSPPRTTCSTPTSSKTQAATAEVTR